MVIIGRLSYPEQKLLNRIKAENGKKNGNPPLFIIHNLQTFSLKEQVEDYIEEALLKSATFKLKKLKFTKAGENTKNDISTDTYLIEEFYDKNDVRKIYHLILAMHGTEAGEYYNQFIYDFLSQLFNAEPQHQPFSIIDEVKEQFCNSSQNIMEKQIKLSDFEDKEDEIKLKSSSEDGKKKDIKI